MAANVEVKDVPAQPAAVIRYKTSMDNMGERMGEIFGKVMAYVDEHDLQPSGMPFSLYLTMSPDAQGNWEVVSGIPVTSQFTGGGEIESFELPGGKVAVATHMGPYDTLAQTYGAMQEWVKENELQPAGPMWEYYFTDPNAEPDVSKWQTDIYMPVT